MTTNLVDNDLYQAKIRVDDNVSDRVKIFGVYSVERGGNGVPQAEYYSPRGNLGGVNIPGGGLISSINSQIASLNLTTTFSPTLTNELYVAGVYSKQNFIPKSLAATQGNPYGGLFANGSTVQPELQDYGNDGLPIALTPDGSYGGIFASKQIITAGDNVTKVFGKHTVRAGIFYQHDINHQVTPFIDTNGAIDLYYFPETYTDPIAGLVHDTGVVGSGNGGNYLADFAEGHVFQYNQTNIAPAPNLFFYNLDGYVQDHWRVTQRLTVDAGIRLEHFTPGRMLMVKASRSSVQRRMLPVQTLHFLVSCGTPSIAVSQLVGLARGERTLSLVSGLPTTSTAAAKPSCAAALATIVLMILLTMRRTVWAAWKGSEQRT